MTDKVIITGTHKNQLKMYCKSKKEVQIKNLFEVSDSQNAVWDPMKKM